MATFKQLLGGVWKTVSTAFTFPNSRTGGRNGFGRGSVYLPGSNLDWTSRAGTLWHNSVVAPCIYYLMDVIGEAPIVVNRKDSKGKLTAVPNHPLTLLCARPNPEYSGALLWAGTVLSLKVDGNAYWKIERNGAGLPVQLWYVPHWLIEPRYPTDGSQFISHYEYRPNGVPEDVKKEDIVHFRYGIDPTNTRKGLAPLKAALREVVSDNEATTYTVSILQNMGVPGAVAELEGDIEEPAKEKFKRLWRAMTKGDARGDLVIVPQGTKITMQGFSPEQLAIDKIRQIPEARICAALRVDPMVIGLSVGEGQRTYSNMKEAKEGTYESAVIPLQDRCADELDIQLLNQLSIVPDIEQVGWDRSEVRVLQEDQDARVKRTNDIWKSGLLTRDEARGMLNLSPAPKDGEVYFTDLNVPVPKDEPPTDAQGKPSTTDAKKALKAAQLVLRSAAELRRRESADGTETEDENDAG